MPSAFVDHLLKPLDLSRPPSPQRPALQDEVFHHAHETTIKQTLRSLLVSLNQPLSDPLVNDTVESLMQLERSSSPAYSVEVDADAEEKALKQAIISRLVVGLYSEALDVCISQAMDAETEAEWWTDVVRSRRNVAMFLLQSILIPSFYYIIHLIFHDFSFSLSFCKSHAPCLANTPNPKLARSTISLLSRFFATIVSPSRSSSSQCID